MDFARMASGLRRGGFVAAISLVMSACAARIVGVPHPGSDGGTHDDGGTVANDAGGPPSGMTDGGGPTSGDGAPGPAVDAAPLVDIAPVVHTTAVNRVDILFEIDNSASMGDKQSFLAQSIPDLITRLVEPNCIDPSGVAAPTRSVEGACPSGERLEFPPVRDLHLGVVTTALGPRLSEPAGAGGVCDPAATAPTPFANLSAHNDDQAHLVARSLTMNGATGIEAPVNAAAPGNYLYWFPQGTGAAVGPVTPEATVGGPGEPGTLVGDSTAMASGAGIFGCGIESQLESWYRFLVQPDPYASLQPSGAGVAPADMWQGVDATILQQRKDFLRPDSAVVIVVLTDENDSEIDVRSLGGQGYFFMRTGFVPPRGTRACLANPGDPNCVSCSVNKADPNCANGNYKAANDWGFDMNLRHVHMKAKYGLDPQYPIQRYVTGLTSPAVPDRNGEYRDANGNSTINYLGRNTCTNPLFAAALPDGSTPDPAHLCQLPAGPRTPDLVTFAVIGGVPPQLLHYAPGDATASELSPADWTRILGRSPLSFDYGGIDPHMIEDYRDRTTVNYPFSTDSSATNPLAPATGANTDATNGREWVTDQEMTPNTHVLRVDRQYACTFPLPAPRDCTLDENGNSCDCPALPGGLTAAQTPPVCNGTTQIAGKAYPTPRELLVAQKVGSRGVVGSICPIHATDQAGGDDPLFGYRPTMSLIGDRLRNALAGACLPQPLAIRQGGGTTCMILAELPASAGGSCLHPTCDPAQGLSVPSDAVLESVCASEEAQYTSAGGPATGLVDPATQSLCVLEQIVVSGQPGAGVLVNVNDFDSSGSCAEATDKGWCYVTPGTAAASCNQSLGFAGGSPPAGATARLYCGG
jgi:hypothetical protein